MKPQSVTLLTLILLTWTISSPSEAMRGPHHPRNSPKVSHQTGHDHHHYVPPPRAAGEPAPIITHDKNLLHDKEHIKEDLGDWVDSKDMTPEEMEFHYFKMHDFDNNSMLDGLEILQAISHVLPMPDEETETVDLTRNIPLQPNADHSHPDQENVRKLSPQELEKQKEDDFNYYIELIDKVLEEDDINKDGYLSYFEYVVGRRREEKKEKVLHSSNPT